MDNARHGQVAELVKRIIQGYCHCDMKAGYTCGIHTPLAELARMAAEPGGNTGAVEVVVGVLSGDLCPDCGMPLRAIEGCFKCLAPGCGYSKC